MLMQFTWIPESIPDTRYFTEKGVIIMLSPGFISYSIFKFTKKHTKKQNGVKRNFFLLYGAVWACICLVIALFMVLGQPSERDVMIRFLVIAPITGIILGEIIALVSWLVWFRKEI